MASSLKERTDEMVKSNLIPAGRERDYREISAPSVDFLDMVIDEQNMYVAPLAITNGSEDRDGEVTNPDGMIDIAYRSNPIVFLQHSHRISPMIPPVGNAETPQRVYDVSRQGDTWYSGCRFSQSTRFARQVFAMVADGLVRGRSIGALNHALSPYKPKLPGVAFHQNQIIPVRTKSVIHDQYELVEWSWVYIPSNRDMVTPIKSLIAKGWIDDRPIDPALKYVMKSFDLHELTSNAKHIAKRPRFSWPNLSGEKTMKSPAAILFHADLYGMPQVAAFISKNADLGILPTEIETTTINGELFLKSTQFKHVGPFEVVTDKKAPGVQILFAKALPVEETQTDKIEQLVEDTEAGSVQVVEKTAPAPAQAPEPVESPVSAAETDETVVVEDEAVVAAVEKASGPGGMRYLKALITKLSQIADMAEAAQSDLEPEMFEKCGADSKELRTFISKLSEYQNERYGKKPSAEPGDEVGVDEEEDVTSSMSKAVKADLFYGRKQVLPTAFVKGLTLLHARVADERQKSLIDIMLKGIAVPEPPVDQEQAMKAQIREMLARVKTRESVSQLV